MILEWNRQKDEDPCIYSKRHRTETLRVTLFFASWDVPMVPFPLDFHTWCLGTEPGAQRCAEHSRASKWRWRRVEHARHQVAESGDGRVVKAGLGRGRWVSRFGKR